MLRKYRLLFPVILLSLVFSAVNAISAVIVPNCFYPSDSIPPTVNIVPPAMFDCSQAFIMLDASASSSGPQFAYRWSTPDGNIVSGSSTLTAEVNSPGTYILTITNIFNGCSASDSVLVEKVREYLDSVDLQIVHASCNAPLGQIKIDSFYGGLAPFSFSINGGLTFSDASVFNDMAPGMYSVIIEDAGGCTYAEDIIIASIPAPVVNIPASVILTPGGTTDIHAIVNIPDSQLVSVTWSPQDGLSCVDCLDPVLTAIAEGSYTIIVTDLYGCVDSATMRVSIENNYNIYIPEAFSPNDDGVNDWFYIYSSNGIIANIKKFLIFDRWGNLVFGKKNLAPNTESEGWDGVYKGMRMTPGVFAFFIEVELADGEIAFFKGDVMLLR